MNTFVTMLRGINVSGQKTIKMADLEGLYESQGFTEVQTYIQSGNVVFGSRSNDAPEIAKTISRAINDKYGFDVPVVIRKDKELEKVVSRNRLIGTGNRDVNRFHVTFLAEAPDSSLVKQLDPPLASDEAMQIIDKEIYLYCPNGYGKTKVNNNYFEKQLSVPATTRNWKTVNVLLGMTRERGD
jgi:uncharacterized protein (DUF1697 family)